MKKNDTPVVMQAEVEENYQYFLEAVEHEGYLLARIWTKMNMSTNTVTEISRRLRVF